MVTWLCISGPIVRLNMAAGAGGGGNAGYRKGPGNTGRGQDRDNPQ
jgi:hypothetical protein